MMTAYKYSSLFLLLLTTLFFASCNPDDEPDPRPPLADNSAIIPFLNQHKPGIQTFTINTQNPGVVTGSKGTRFIFQGNSFTLPGGEAVTGQIELQMVEVYDRGDMLLTQRPPTFRGRLLHTAGQIFLEAKQNGTILHVSNATLQLPQQDTIPSTSPKELFVDSTETAWRRPSATDTLLVDYISADSSVIGEAYYQVTFTNDALGWFSVAHVDQTATSRAVNGRLQNIGSYNGFVVYCVYGGEVRAVSPFSVHSNGDFYSDISLPDLIPVTLVAVGNQEGRYYYGEKKYTSGPTEIYHHITVNEISEQDLVAKLDSL